MSHIYKCWLGKNRLVVGVFTIKINNKEQILSDEYEEPHFYYEGELSECIYNNTIRNIPHGQGTITKLKGTKTILSGTFDMGQINGFANVMIPSLKAEINCEYINGIPDKNSSYMIFDDDKLNLCLID